MLLLTGGGVWAQETPNFVELIRKAVASTDRDAAAAELATAVVGYENEFLKVLKSGSWRSPMKAGWHSMEVDKHGPWVEGDPGHDEMNHVLYHTAGGTKHRPLVILSPYTSGRSRDLINEALQFSALGYDALIVPAREVGTGWTALPVEHRDILTALRYVLVTGPVNPDRVILTGFSRGGHASWDVGLRNAGRFAAIFPRGGTMVHSGGYTRTGGVFLENAHDLAVLVSWGMKDAAAIVEGNTEGSKVLKDLGYVIDSRGRENLGHVPVLKVAEMVEFAKGRVRPHVPKKLIKIANLPWDGRHHWLQILKRKKKPWAPSDNIEISGKMPPDGIAQRRVIWKAVSKKMCRVTATLDGNKVILKTKKVAKKIRLQWRTDMFDLEKFVYVMVNGRKKFSGKLTRDMKYLIREFLETGDCVRLWDGAINVNS